MKFFNTAGPVRCQEHYCLPPLERFDLKRILSLIDQKKYFVLHAPRQTGKTSCLLALVDYLNEQGQYRAVYVNVEMGQSAREDVYRGVRAVLSELASSARNFLRDEFPFQNMKEILELWGEDSALNMMLSQWSNISTKPLVVILDEIDSLIGDTLISVLRQVRGGYHKRPAVFPQSIILCGVRNVRDYRIHSSKEKEIITGGSAFNIKAESLRLGDFTREDVTRLYRYHTEETGQPFEDRCLDLVWELTCGQPWLVNALGYEACFNMKEGLDRGLPVTAALIERAVENIILRRETHIDQLVDKLREDRVRRVIEPILAGKSVEEDFIPEEVQYVIDLGLLRQDRNGALHLSNRIYREVIPRELAWSAQMGIHEQTAWYLDPDGRLDMNKLLAAFQEFFREHSEHWVERFQYKEAGPQLLMQAFLQRIVNSGGRIEREYGLGRMRTDLLVIWPYGSEGDNRQNRQEKKVQKTVIELKVLHKGLEKTMEDGLKQTAAYMDRCGAREGHLILFDRSREKSWEEKIFCREEAIGGGKVTVWGM